jgi:hypothetical protein
MYKKVILVLLVGLFALGACAGMQEKPQVVSAKAGERKVAMTATSYSSSLPPYVFREQVRWL